MSVFKLQKCPFCNADLIFESDQQNLINTTSEEHIIPKSLGNDDLVLKKGIICDKCNNYFALNIEKPFLEMEPIKLLRAYHLVESRKKKVPPLDVLFCGDKAVMQFDKKSHSLFLGVSPETSFKIMNECTPTHIISKGVNIEELKNNYNVSRFLVKVFLELNLYYSIKELQNSESLDDDFYFVFDKKMSELVKYVRLGSKDKIYEYKVRQTKEIKPFSNDDFIASVSLNFKDTLNGITLNLYELEFDMKF